MVSGGHVVVGHLHRHMRHLPQQLVRAKYRVPGEALVQLYFHLMTCDCLPGRLLC